MRRTLLASCAAGLLLSLGTVQSFAQSAAYPAETTITAPEVEVRSGPTDKFYPTSKLRQGERVVVLCELKDQPGWVAIKPPLGSFSWVDGKNVKMVTGALGYVQADDGNAVQILPGSALVNQEPNVKSQQLKSGAASPLELKAGTAIEVVDKALTINNQTWLPIKPHVSEVRFLRADAVKAPVAVASTGPPNWTLKSELFTTNPQLAEAEQAYKAGNQERARQLYREVADHSPDQNQKVFAMNRLASLGQGSGQPGYPGTTTAWQGPANTKTTSFSPSLPAPAAGVLHALLPPQWSNYGYLRPTTLEADGQPVYVIENPRGQAPLYVTTRTGTTLRDYVGKMVCVFGPTVYRGDGVRMQYIVASHVALP